MNQVKVRLLGRRMNGDGTHEVTAWNQTVELSRVLDPPSLQCVFDVARDAVIEHRNADVVALMSEVLALCLQLDADQLADLRWFVEHHESQVDVLGIDPVRPLASLA